MFKYEISKTKKIILTALLTATFVVLDRQIAINTQFIAINLSLIAVMLAAIILGLKHSVIVATLGDLIGALLFPFGPYFVGFTISSAITGLIFGLFLYKNPNKKTKNFTLKIIISNLLVLLFVSICLNSICLHIMYGKALIYYLGMRVSTQIVMFPIYTILMILLNKALSPVIKKYLYTEERISIDEYLSQFSKFTKNPTLDGMKYLTEKFDSPQKKLKSIHIAGTNGKGSVAEMLSNVLQEADYKVGKFISPHLINFNDGILINGEPIKTEEAELILNDLSKIVEEYNEKHKENITWFEVITTLILIYFAKKECDFVVIETGLGGALDCTNIVESMISIITNIGYDHVDILGDTIEKITKQKAGIIKENTETVAIYQKETAQIIENVCKEKHTKIHFIKKENVEDYTFTDEEQSFSYKNYKNIKINLKGKVQIYNASQVLECIDILKQKGYLITNNAIQKGLNSVVHKARMEEISKDPLIVFDGGHNENAIINFRENVKQYYSNYEQKVYIISILKTKDYKTAIKELAKDENAVYFLTSGNDKKRYVPATKLYKEVKKYIKKDNLYQKEFKEAIKIAKEKYNKAVIFIIGSFYVYKDVIENFKG